MTKNNLSVLVQMDPLENINFNSDSTISIIEEGLKRGHNIFFCRPQDIFISSQRKKIRCKKFKFKNSGVSISNNLSEYEYSHFKVIFLRQDPPFDISYVTNLHLHMVQSELRNADNIFFINSPLGILKFSEKLYALDYPEITPKTDILNELEDIKKFIRKNKKIVIKPLYDKGGSGVTLIEKLDKNSIGRIAALTKNFTQKIVVQKFMSKVSKGDKRVLLIDGKPVGAINRVPSPGSFKANLHLGAQAKKTNLSKTELNICKQISPSLKKNGLFFVGIDIIDNKLTEINVTSPTGINQINRMDGVSIQKTLWKQIEKKIQFKAKS